MKKYKKIDNTANRNIIIQNEDEHKIIKKITFKLFKDSNDSQIYSVSIDFEKLTSEFTSTFNSLDIGEIGESSSELELMLSNSIIPSEKALNKALFDVLNTIQLIDPLPLKALEQLGSKLDADGSIFNFSEYVETIKAKDLGVLNLKQVKCFMDEDKHQSALSFALDANSKGDCDILDNLVLLYQELGDQNLFINVLESIPKAHPFFIDANESIRTILLSETSSLDESEKSIQVERLFRVAFNLDSPEVGRYYEELSGGIGEGFLLDLTEGTLEGLIQLAGKINSQNIELKELRAYKNTNENQTVSGNKTSNNAFFKPETEKLTEKHVLPQGGSSLKNGLYS